MTRTNAPYLTLKAALGCSVAWIAMAAGSGSAMAQTAQAQGSTAIETVVVTASRRSEALQNVASQVTALSADELQKIHANSFGDFAGLVPGVSYESGGPAFNLIAIRGVTTGGTQLGSAIAMYVDDVPVGASTQFGLGFQSLNVGVFDMNRVEILNGPQGTLYGANALGGTIKYITQAPDLDQFDARLELEGSDTAHGGYNDGVRAEANMPFDDGQMALRLDGIQEYDTGYTSDPVYGGDHIGSALTLGGRASFLWQASPDVSVRLSAMTQNITANGGDVIQENFVTHQPVYGSYGQVFPLGQPDDNSLQLYSGVVNWNLHWANLTSVTGWQYNHGQSEEDLSTLYDFLLGAPGVPFGLPVDTNTQKFTQEVRLTSADSKIFEWVVGGYFTHEITDETVDLVDGAAPGGLLPPYGVQPFTGYLPSTYREFAGFVDGTYFVTDKFDITGGVRYSEQHQDYQSFISSILFGPPFGHIYHYGATSDQGVATYLINPRYHLTDDTMLYARVASGYRPGGPNFVLPGDTVPATFQSDQLWNYEVGEKSTLFGGRGTLNADIYDVEWSAIQTTVNVDGINQLENAGDARVEGAEMAFNYRLLDNLTVGGSGAYTDAFLTKPSPVIGVHETGARIPLSPRYNFALSGDYAFELGDGFSGALNIDDVYVGERTAGYNVPDTGLQSQETGTGNPLFKLPAYNTVNLNLALFLTDNVELDWYVKNVFDVRGEVSASTVTDQYVNPNFLGLGVPYAPVPVLLSQPRTFGLVFKIGLDK
ncbi:MAG: TonB-dependent receptor [Rhizomicrobium sp.]